MIYDISQPLLECHVFPGDIKPEKTQSRNMDDGDDYNLSEISLCVHNGTHVDAPYHFINDGKGIGQVALGKFIGKAYVVTHEGVVTAEDAKQILDEACSVDEEAGKRILIKGKATVSLEAATVFAEAGIYLIGNESQTVGPEDGPMAVHLVLLGKEVVLLEGIRLGHVPDGVYMLNCAPINLSHTDGAPCRAVLIQ
ncbi:MAG: cyclase family protein [Lachnospiraceae bacterium]|nr:cyclase family protein [Lachnospiraceae bacterium]